MLDDALPGSRVLSAAGQNRINCALADNDAETNMRAAERNPVRFRCPCQPSTQPVKRSELMSSFLDQSQLIDLAERLVSAARRAGADAADAVAVRSISLSVDVRDGAVEESARAEGDDMGLRVLVGKCQAVVSTNDTKGNGADALAERAVAMARVAPEDKFAGLADAELLACEFPDLDLVDPELPGVTALETQARAAEAAGLAVKGVSKSGGAGAAAGIGGMVLVTSHGFRGAYVRSPPPMSGGGDRG